MIKCDNGKTILAGEAADIAAEFLCILIALEDEKSINAKELIKDYYNGEFERK